MSAVHWCGVLCTGVVCCTLVWCAVCTGVVSCALVWCAVHWCGVLCTGVVCCALVWCAVHWCGVLCTGVVCCALVWCAVHWRGVLCTDVVYVVHGYGVCSVAVSAIVFCWDINLEFQLQFFYHGVTGYKHKQQQ